MSDADSTAPPSAAGRKRFKWEPIALLAVVTLVGVLLVTGSERTNVRIGPVRGKLEIRQPTETEPGAYRLAYRNDETTRWMSGEEFSAFVGTANFQEILKQRDNAIFRLFNITSWAGLAWVTVGLLGQVVFMGRMAVQWIVSERRRESVVPPVFWYLSLVGGLMLFSYFVWRQDIVGVLGQTSGVAIYARNIRLIHKRRRRERRGLNAAAR